MKLIKNPVLGAICGDMIGVPYEWYCKQGLQIPENFKLWTDDSKFSDDSVMTIAIADGLLHRDINLIEIMQKWGRKYRHAGYGHLFGQWIDSDNPQPYGSFGNGSAMRVSPVACVAKSLEECLELAKKSAEVTHNHPEGIKGAQAIAELIYKELHAKDTEADWFGTYASVYDSYNLNRTPEQIIKSGYRFNSTCQGSVPEAICCFLNSDSYEETIRNAIMLRGDADTQAAIAGSIAAACWGIPRDIANEGLERLPNDMFKVLEDFSEKYNLDI